MRVEPLVPDTAFSVAPVPRPNAFGALVDAASSVLAAADGAEAAFVAHRGGMQEMVVERARADIAVQIAASATQHVAQSLQTLLGMQI
jgi:hypothetical protein